MRTDAFLQRATRNEALRAAVILLALLNICFFTSIWGDATLLDSARDQPSIMPRGAWEGRPLPIPFPKTLDTGAPDWQTEAWLALIRTDYLHDKILPLWNPYQGYGEPLAANMLSQAYYPLTLLLSLHLTPRTYSWYILLHLYIAGLCAYFYLRLFVSFLPALAGSIASLLAGYYVLFLTMHHLSVETLIPAALLTGEHLLRRPRYSNLLWFALVVACILLGGMPESALLLFTFLAFYFLWRMLSDADIRQHFWPAAWRLLVGGAAGTGLCAFLLLPFLEYMHLSFDTHQPGNIGGAIEGLGFDTRTVSALTYFFPLVFGPLFSGTIIPGWNGCRNYVGLLSVFPASLAVYAITRRAATVEAQKLRRVAMFFAASIVLIVCKRYGADFINPVGSLPYFQLVQFPKYDEPLLSISYAVLCAIGLEMLCTAQVSRRVQVAALGFTALLLAFPWLYADRILRWEIAPGRIDPEIIYWALGVPAVLVLVLAICLFLFWKRPAAFAICVVACLGADLTLNYIVPVYYVFNKLPDRASNPYKGAPFINYLRANATVNDRVFGRDGVLYPNWAAAFQFFDIRDLDAMYYRKYFPFLRNFFPGVAPTYGADLFDRWTGTGNYNFSDQLSRRLLQLSSVKYLIAPTSSAAPFDPSFKRVYAKETQILENDDRVPRAAIYYSADIAPNSADVLHKLADPNLDVFETTVLDGSQLTASEIKELRPLTRNTAPRVDAASITSYKPQDVQIDATLHQPGILVLSDSDYPGWTADVDGHPTEWFSANYLFRGVFLAPGAHHVAFVYRPSSFSRGVKISAASILLLILMPWAERLKNKRSPGRQAKTKIVNRSAPRADLPLA